MKSWNELIYFQNASTILDFTGVCQTMILYNIYDEKFLFVKEWENDRC